MTTRARSTWTQGDPTPRQAAVTRRADIYTMNQEHPQPAITDYETGDPDAWAETPVSGEKMSVGEEYEGEKVKRNEVGFGEFRGDTWKHKDVDEWGGKGKYDNSKVAATQAAERKAQAAERVARATLRTSNERLVAETALELMALPSASLASMCKRMDAVSPDALSKESKFKRALACCKLAHRLLGEKAEASAVEHLGSVLMGIDDPTLKEIVRAAATAKTAQDQGQDEEPESLSEEEMEEELEKSGYYEKPPRGPEPENAKKRPEKTSQDGGAADVDGGSDEGCLSPADEQLLMQMLHPPAGAVPAVPAVPVAPMAPTDELTSLFTPPPRAPAPAMPMPAMAASTASDIDISFEEAEAEEEGLPVTAAGNDLDNLFGDHPEVQAQRDIRAALEEQASRAQGGFAPIGRTASAQPKGAKKLGAVQAPKGGSDEALASIWDRP